MPFVLMIAGPNGSGKTTLTTYLRAQGIDLGDYINPDDMAARLEGSYDLRVELAQKKADARRLAALQSSRSFSFETVMSHDSKVEFFRQCRDAGYETILYFVSTIDPMLNVARVRQRVALGGHDVPTDRIIARYARSHALLPFALEAASRAAIFDNSDERGLMLGLAKSTFGEPHCTVSPDAPKWILDLLPARRR